VEETHDTEPVTLTPVAASLTLGSAEGVTVTAPTGGWPTGSQVFVDGTAHPEIPATGNNPVVVPYALLSGNGPHTIEIRSSTRTYRIDNVQVRPPTAESGTLPTGVTLEVGTGNPSGPTGQPLNVAQIRNDSGTAANFLVTYQDGTVQRVTVPAKVGDTPGRATITVPATRTATAGSYPLVISVPQSSYLRPMTFDVRPPVATLRDARITSTASYYFNDQISLTVTSDQAGPARITVGNYTQDVTLIAGANPITMTGAPKTWNTGSTGRQTLTVKIQPLNGTTLAGTEVTVGSVSIQRAGGGGGHHAPATPRPARPVP
jgi:hypothetical protein